MTDPTGSSTGYKFSLELFGHTCPHHVSSRETLGLSMHEIELGSPLNTIGPWW